MAGPSLLRVGFAFSSELEQFDPARVQVAAQYMLLENLYSPLIIKDNDGTLRPGVAERFQWEGDEIRFDVRSNLIASDGLEITAEDVYFSMMRLLVLRSSTHGDLQKLICPEQVPTSVDDKCSGLRIDGSSIFIKPIRRDFAIFDSFSTIDFAVVPKRAVDPRDLKIQNFKITSGPYWIDERRESGTLLLKANAKHFLYRSAMPQLVEFISHDPNSQPGVRLFEEGRIDFMSPLDQGDLEEKVQRYRESSEAEIHMTLPVRLELLNFTEKGLKLSIEDRWKISRILISALSAAHLHKKTSSRSSQYFPAGGRGSLGEMELNRIELARAKTELETIITGEGIVIGLTARSFSKLKPVIEGALPRAKVVLMRTLPAFDKSSIDSMNFPHCFVVSMDTGFTESLPNIVNSVKSEFLGVSKSQREKWLQIYMAEPDELVRRSMLKEIHFLSLINAVTVPIAHTPYIAVLRKPWKGAFSNFFPNSPIWQISRN